MEYVAPLLQTFLWVCLVGGIIYRYHEAIDSILQALQNRIESGSGLKVGPVELQESLKPQNSEQQRKRVEQEVTQLINVETKSELAAKALDNSSTTLRSIYLQAEDLALRAIQSEYKTPLNRNLQAAPDFGFDGFFVHNGKGHIVEVKYSSLRFPPPLAKETVDRIFSRIKGYGWKNVRVILVIVHADESLDLVKEKDRLLKAIENYGDQVELKCYSMSKLGNQFGLQNNLNNN